MGVSCGKKGRVLIADDDVIEKSNLSSHFLFRQGNIGRHKTTVAAASIRASINQQLNIEALLNRVDKDTEDVFNAAFWDKVDVVVSALDNLDTKLYVDKRCLYFKKPFLESETLGTQCTTHMVIPDLTENYGAIRDPPEKQAEVTPCIATSTAMAAGFVCLELYKVLGGGHKIEDYRNVDTNLVVPSFTMSKPVAAKVARYREMSWTVWDRWVIKFNPTVKQVFDWIAEKGFKCNRLYYGSELIYQFNDYGCYRYYTKTVAGVLKKQLRLEIPPYRCHVDVEAMCVDKDDETIHIDIPLVSVYFREPEEAGSSV